MDRYKVWFSMKYTWLAFVVLALLEYIQSGWNGVISAVIGFVILSIVFPPLTYVLDKYVEGKHR